MGTAEGMETRDFALERFRREGCNLLRERFFSTPLHGQVPNL